MSAGIYNGFIIEAGADFAPGAITWKDGSGSPINLTGYSARMDIKKDITSSSIMNMTNANGRITLGGAAGTITLKITAADTTTLPAGAYKYDLELQSGTGVVVRLLQGSITVRENVTV